MKKILFFIFFFFLFVQKSNGQVEPRLVEKLTREYAGTIYKWVDKTLEIFKYDNSGNKIEHSVVTYNILEEIETWEGVRFEYNEEGLLEKELVGRYNWEVGVWVVEYWINYFYDGNGCVEKRHRIYNLDPLSWVEITETDANCLETEFKRYNSNNEAEALSISGVMEYEYDDRNNVVYSTFQNRVFNLWSCEITEQDFNNQDDLIYKGEYSGNSACERTGEDYIYLFDYEYQFDSKNRLVRKIITSFESPEFTTDTLDKGITEILYEYSCDDILLKEDISDIRYLLIGDTLYNQQRIFYTYEGKNNCFDFENKLTATFYPNPTSGFVQIESPLLVSGNTQIRLLDINGKVLLGKIIYSREEKASLDINHLVNGTYFLQLMSGEHFISKKVVIVK